MKHTLIALLFIAVIASAHAAPPPISYTIEADYQQTQSLPNQSFQQGAGVRLRYKLMSNGSYLTLTGLTGKWQGRSSVTSTNYITQLTATTVTNVTPNYFQLDLDYTATGTAVTNWVYSMIATDSGTDYVMGEGRLDIQSSAWTGAGATITADSCVNSIIAGSNITLSPTNGIGDVTITASVPVTSLTAGTGITLSPTNGLGDVTISATATDSTNTLSEVLTAGASAGTQTMTDVSGIVFVPNGGNTNHGAVTASATDDTLQYQTSIAGVVEQLGQELQTPAKKVTTNSISNGNALEIYGESGDKPLVRAIIEGNNADNIIGMSTHDWSSNDGRVTSFGLVRDLDTATWGDAGAKLWANTNGVSTNQFVDSTFMGWIIRSHGTDGTALINVNPPEADPYFKSVSNLFYLASNPAGYITTPPANDTTTTNIAQNVTTTNITSSGTVTAEQITSTDDITAGDKIIADGGNAQLSRDQLVAYPGSGQFSVYTDTIGALLALSSRGAEVKLGWTGGVTNYLASHVTIHDSTGLNTTFTNGNVIAEGTVTASAFVGDSLVQSNTAVAQYTGTLNGTNGVYWTALGTNYWMLLE